jgi:hypothetical protein
MIRYSPFDIRYLLPRRRPNLCADLSGGLSRRSPDSSGTQNPSPFIIRHSLFEIRYSPLRRRRNLCADLSGGLSRRSPDVHRDEAGRLGEAGSPLGGAGSLRAKADGCVEQPATGTRLPSGGGQARYRWRSRCELDNDLLMEVPPIAWVGAGILGQPWSRSVPQET